MAAASTRMIEAFQRGLLTLERLRNGGKQTVVVQHVAVSEGGQAVVAGTVTPGANRSERGSPNTQLGHCTGRRPRSVSVRSENPPLHALRWPSDAERPLPNAWRRQHGPRTPEGMERLRRAPWKHGQRGAEAREAARDRGAARREMAALNALLRELDELTQPDVMP